MVGRLILAAGALVCSLLLAHEAIVVAGSEMLAASGDHDRIMRAETLWPRNPEAYYQDALLLLQPLNNPQYQRAVGEIRRSVALDPKEPRYWKELASACEILGDLDCAEKAMRTFRRAEPKNPEVLWLTANFDIRHDQAEAGIRELSEALRMAPDYDQAVLLSVMNCIECTRRSVEEMFIAAGPTTELRYMEHLVGTGDGDDAFRLWRELAAHTAAAGKPLSFESVAPYLNAVMQRGQGGQARTILADLEKLGVINPPLPLGNLVFNGGFENPAGSGPGWTVTQAQYASTDVTPGGFQGDAYLRTDFPVNRNDDFILAYQLIPVEPDTPYELSAWVRSEAITSDSGPRLHIFDAACPKCLDMSTDSTTGSTPWHRIRMTFHTGPAANMIRLQLDRPRSRTYPMEISGSFGLDDVELHKMPLPNR